MNDKQDVVAFLKLRQFNYDILPDAKDVSKSYNVSAWPTHMVIDKNSIVKFVQVGGKDIAKKLSKVINHVL